MDNDDRFRRQNGVADAAQVNFTPVSGAGWNENTWADQGDQTHHDSYYNRVGSGYFRTMGIPITARMNVRVKSGVWQAACDSRCTPLPA